MSVFMIQNGTLDLPYPSHQVMVTNRARTPETPIVISNTYAKTVVGHNFLRVNVTGDAYNGEATPAANLDLIRSLRDATLNAMMAALRQAPTH